MALKESLSQDKELTVENTSLGVIGTVTKAGKRKLEPFKLYDGQEIAPLLEAALESAGTGGEEETSGEPMETDQ
jgi:20S proteasome subunit alpha 6